MTPTKIPDAEVWDGAQRLLVHGYADVADVHTVVDTATGGGLDGASRFCIRLELDDDDRSVIADGGVIWLSMFGQVIPFAFDVLPAAGVDPGYHVELEGHRFNQAQWEAIERHIALRDGAPDTDTAAGLADAGHAGEEIS